MKRFLVSILAVLILSCSVLAQSGSNAPLRVKEIDDFPSGTPTILEFPNGSLSKIGSKITVSFPAISYPVTSVFGRAGTVVKQSGDYDFSDIGSKPSTLAGYGITDAVSGSGTIGKLPKFTAARVLGNSLLEDNGTTLKAGGPLGVFAFPAANTLLDVTNFAYSASGSATGLNVLVVENTTRSLTGESITVLSNANTTGLNITAISGANAANLFGGTYVIQNQAGKTISSNAVGISAQIQNSGAITATNGPAVSGSVTAFNGSSWGRAQLLRGIVNVFSGGTITEVRGLDLSSWSNSGTIPTSYGIYMDSSIDVGATKYAFYSLSTSPSQLAGSFQATVVNATTGFRVNGAAPSGQYTRGDGTNFVASAIQTGDLPATVSATTYQLAGGVLYLSTAPTVTSGFGVSPAIAGKASSFKLTVGTGGDTSGVVAFNGTFTNAPGCYANDETSNVLVRAVSTTTQVTVSGVLASGDVIKVLCVGY